MLEAMPNVLNVDIAAANFLYLKEVIRYYKIPIVTDAKITSLTDHTVSYNINGEKHSLHADTVIVSIGYQSDPQINNSSSTFYTIGDAAKVSNLLGAIWSAYETAMNI